MSFLLLSLSSFSLSAQAADKVVTLPLVPHHEIARRRRSLTKTNRYNEAEEQERRNAHYQARSASLFGGSTKNDSAEQTAKQVSVIYQGYGTHYVDLWVGTPPQRQTVIIDTGSGVTAFPCATCTHCGVPEYHASRLFQQDDSITFRLLTCDECTGYQTHCDWKGKTCRMEALYGEGSFWYAQQSEDVAYLGGSHYRPVHQDQIGKLVSDLDPTAGAALAIQLQFFCQDFITGLFVPQLADGIMGMDRDSLSWVRQMKKQGKVDREAFSLCFVRAPNILRDGSEAGTISLGGTDTRLHRTPMVYTDRSYVKGGWYGVHIRKVYLREGGGGDFVTPSTNHLKIIPLKIDEDAMNTGEIIVDSGTTNTFLHKSIGDALYTQYKEMTGRDWDHDWKSLTPEELDRLPTVLMQLRGDESRNKQVAADFGKQGVVPGLVGQLDPQHPYDVLIAIPPSHYYEYRPDTGKVANRLFADGRGMSILGANSMMGHDILFDLDHNILGWAESTCDYDQLLNRNFDGAYPPQWKEPVEMAWLEGRSRNAVCSGFLCQLSCTAIIVVLLFAAHQKFKKRKANAERQLSNVELEM
ncbi:hypothetical protein FisN_37Hh035 [Fistulifera solaris]|uniref:Peptidase A1 domain-containing protein n=1 Tax=Fistulifera solaris TaxID=1519565 RepID=A0A1Z5KJW8_FISSO|nr:hypothetical protein FisN_37Hh035 [Fistulifera solaris]|eukprot:GAX26415.1 hypothetical protein FisN_37Hh035 [Fistulifera solaris]